MCLPSGVHDCTDAGPYLVGDLWQFTPNAAGNGGTWTWYPTPSKQYYAGGCLPGVVGAATLGGRVGASYWTDANGSVWVFGGLGFGASNTATCQTVGSSPVSGYLNDLWKYTNGQWTLVAGPATLNQPGSYGKQGVAAGTNLPPPRFHAAAWQDLRGNFRMFGGAKGPYGNSLSAYNDLWEFVYNTKTWIWIGGSQGAVQVGANHVGPGPGPRAGAAGGAIGFADFSVYGGLGENATAPGPFPNPLNDFWQGVGVVYDWP